MRHVIVGNGIAGISAAQVIRARDSTAEILIIFASTFGDVVSPTPRTRTTTSTRTRTRYEAESLLWFWDPLLIR